MTKFHFAIFAAFCAISSPAFSQVGVSDQLVPRSRFAIELMEANQDPNSLLGATINSTGPVTQVSAYALNMIAHFEGWRSEKYDDPAGYCTIGYGRLFKKAPCATLTTQEITRHVTLEEFENGISVDRGLELLSDDVEIAARFVAGAAKERLKNLSIFV